MSGKPQAKGGTTSLERQHENMDALAKELNLECVDRLDFTESGRDLESERLQTILSRARADDHDVCLMEDVDRSFRSVRTGVNFVHEYVEVLGKELWISGRCLNEMGTDEWTMFLITLVFAENKSRKNGDASEGKRRRIRKYGYWYRKEIPFGYLKGNPPDPTSKVPVLMENEELVPGIEALFDVFAQRHWMEAIHDPAVAALGFDSKQREAVFQVLRNPVYKGDVPHAGGFVHCEAVQIIEPDVWRRANRGLPGARKRRTRTAKTPLIELVRQATCLYYMVRDGLVTCPTCRTKMKWAGPVEVEGVQVPRLSCSNGHVHRVATVEDVRALKSDKTCWSCAAAGADAFDVRHDPCAKAFVTKCLHCDWTHTSTHHPFKDIIPVDGVTGEPVTVSQRRIARLPRTTRGRGRRKRRR